jgi:hypothetical protein
MTLIDVETITISFCALFKVVPHGGDVFLVTNSSLLSCSLSVNGCNCRAKKMIAVAKFEIDLNCKYCF